MTPQLQQAIKLLTLSNLEIESYVAETLEANPLLEVGEVSREGGEDAPVPDEHDSGPDGSGAEALDIDAGALDPEAAPGDTGDWSRAADGGGGLAGEDGPDLENRGGAGETLAEHLNAQIGSAAHDPREALIAARLVGEIDDAGYFVGNLDQIAEELGAPLGEVERALTLVQTFDPTGVGARSLGECLAIQAKEADRYDPCMARLIDNLDLLARGDIARLKRLCDIDDEDFADMLAELRGYDPKPGCRFETGDSAAIIPDVLVTPAPGGGWDVRLNEATLPRLVINRQYYVTLKDGARDKAARRWLDEQLGEADWLIRALDQRQKTILKTAAEILRRQDGFLRRGIAAMRPLTLREVAEGIEMHESTVSRVTSNKYLACPRGTFELKFFFSSGVPAADGEGASNAAIKARIRALCDSEDPAKVLSDEALVAALRGEGFDLARRTVAKYREAAGIGSSAQRRREKRLRSL